MSYVVVYINEFPIRNAALILFRTHTLNVMIISGGWIAQGGGFGVSADLLRGVEFRSMFGLSAQGGGFHVSGVLLRAVDWIAQEVAWIA